MGKYSVVRYSTKKTTTILPHEKHPLYGSHFQFFVSIIVFQLFILYYFNDSFYTLRSITLFSPSFLHKLLLNNFMENKKAVSGYTDCAFTQVCVHL